MLFDNTFFHKFTLKSLIYDTLPLLGPKSGVSKCGSANGGLRIICILFYILFLFRQNLIWSKTIIFVLCLFYLKSMWVQWDDWRLVDSKSNIFVTSCTWVKTHDLQPFVTSRNLHGPVFGNEVEKSYYNLWPFIYGKTPLDNNGDTIVIDKTHMYTTNTHTHEQSWVTALNWSMQSIVCLHLLKGALNLSFGAA